MPLTTVGLQAMLDAVIGVAITAFTNANAYLGVGGGTGATTAFAIGQTDLQGASKARKAMDATFPSRSGSVLTFKSTFASADANQAWDEVGVFNASTAGIMLVRVVQALGTKTAGSTWVLTHTVTFS